MKGSSVQDQERPLRLNVGSGDVVIPGYLAVDRKFGGEAYPLSVGEHTGRALINEVQEIRASHVLEHFGHGEVDAVLKEWYRALVPGTGLVRIAVPDFDKILEMRVALEAYNAAAQRRAIDPSETQGENGWDIETLRMWPLYLMGGQTDKNDFHGTIFTRDGLEQRLRQAGFDDIREWSDEPAIDTAMHPVSLRLEAQKPIVVGPGPLGHGEKYKQLCKIHDDENATEPEPDPLPDDTKPLQRPTRAAPVSSSIDINICAVMSVPRLGFNDNYAASLAALSPRQIPTQHYTGAYWEQCIQTAIEICIAEGVDWVIAIDYDTLFTADHLDRMLQHMGDHPEIDALAGLQCRRGKKFPLMTVKGCTQIDMPKDQPIKADTAHFGLTIIKLEALKKVPKPWFWGQPGEDGTWTHWSRLDADIFFWHQWAKAGNTLFVAPDVRIGHMELMVSSFDDNLNPRHTYVADWQREQGHTGITTIGETVEDQKAAKGEDPDGVRQSPPGR